MGKGLDLRSDAVAIYNMYVAGKDSGYTVNSSINRAMLQWNVRYTEDENKDIERFVKHFIKYGAL